MIKTTLGHIQLNIDAENLPFYKDLFAFLGWKTLHENATALGVGSADTSLWFIGNANDAKNDYDGKGMNHLALHVQEQSEVDQWLRICKKEIFPFSLKRRVTALNFLKTPSIPTIRSCSKHRIRSLSRLFI